MSDVERIAAEAAKFVTEIGLHLQPRQLKDLQATVRAFVRQAFKAGSEREREAVARWIREEGCDQLAGYDARLAASIEAGHHMEWAAKEG